MRKLLLLFVFLASAIGSAMGQRPIKVQYKMQDPTGIPFRKVRIKKSTINDFLFSKDHQVLFSEKPDGIESGYYVAHSSKGYILDGSKKNKIEIGDERMTRYEDGWYEYDFGKTLYIRKIGLFVEENPSMGNHPIYIIPLSEEDTSSAKANATDVQPNQNDSQATESKPAATNNEKSENVKKVNPFKYGDYDLDGIDDGRQARPISELINPQMPDKKDETYIKTEKKPYSKGNMEIDHFLGNKKTYHGTVDGKKWFVTLKNQDFVDNAWPEGDFQIVLDNHHIVRRQNGNASLELPDGSIIEISPYNYFNLGNIFNEDFSKEIIHLPGQEEPLVRLSVLSGNHWTSEYGFAARNGKKIYEINRNGVSAFAQICNDHIIFANDNDSIIDVSYRKVGGGWNIKYANGDSIYIEEYLSENNKKIGGTIHRNGGILTLGGEFPVLKFPNGDKYIGTFFGGMYGQRGWFNDRDLELTFKDLGRPSLTYKDGMLIKKDGKKIEYKGGKSDTQIEAQKKEEAQSYNALCQRYGKKYVDAAMAQKPIVGMPEELLKAVFNLEVVSQGDNYTQYRIKGFGLKDYKNRAVLGSTTKYIIVVTNGKVSHINY